MFIPVLLLSALPIVIAQADTIRSIKQTNGALEFTNIEKGADTALITDNRQIANKVIYKSNPNDVTTFSDKRPIDNYIIVKFDCYACNPNSTIDWHHIKLNTTSYQNFIKRSSSKYSVDSALVRALIHAESSFNSKAVSKVGAQGLMQLMPATAKELGVYDSLDPQQNIEGGVKYLAKLLAIFGGNIKLATAAYNAGPNAVKKYKGIPPYKETKTYVDRVGVLYRRYQSALHALNKPL